MNILLSPTVGQILAQVDAVLRHDPGASTIGIRAQTPGQWPHEMKIRDRMFSLAWCPSPILVREKLLERERAAEGTGLVILTPVDDQSLGADVLARLSRGRVFVVDSWDIVRNVFQARVIDARLAHWPWVAEALLENMPAEGYPPAPGGFLDMDSAWAHVLQHVLGLSSEHSLRPDLSGLLKWSLDYERVDRYERLSEDAKRQVIAWLSEATGTPGKLAVQCIQAGFALELVAVGLMCGIVFHEHAENSAALLAAAVRLEKYFGGIPVHPGEARYLYQGVRKLLDGLDQVVLDRVLDAGDRLFQSLHLADFAHISDDLPSGFEARLIALGESIRAYLERPGPETAASAAAAADYAIRHRLSERTGLRKARIEMAIRLIRRLEQERQRSQATAADLRRCVTDYVQDGAFVDRARLSLLGGDELARLAQSYNALRERVRSLREQQNRRFAEALNAWLDTGCGPVSDMLSVEKILDEIVAPLARKVPVLLLVIDGLSYPIFTEIVEDALKSGWNEILPIDQPRAPAGLATIPSITEISRASLLCGRLCAGQAAQEKAGFASHPSLTTVSRANAKPIVFHKGELSDSLDLSDQVRDAVGRTERKVVAVVYNGVDDHLSGSDQLQPHWKLDDLRLLRPLLYEARLAGRVIVLTSDHGHVLDEATVSNGSGDGDRWRSCETEPGLQEKLLEGGRVLAPTGERQVVVPWSESLRYGQKRNGYHGGISLQEMVVPICLLTAGAVPEGYRLVGSSFPTWWEASVSSTVPAPAEKTIPPVFPERFTKRKAPTSDNRQGTLFDDDEVFQAEPPRTEDWIESLLSSSTYRSQKQLAARAALKDEEIRKLLEALEERGGKISKSALAQRLGLPLVRVSGFVNTARRLLNVDQVNVLTLDETDGSITLNRTLLETQFKEAFVKPLRSSENLE